MINWLLFALLIAVGVLFYRLHRLRGQYQELRATKRELSHAILASIRSIRQTEITRELKARAITPPIPVEFHAQQGEDLFLWALFEGQTGGAGQSGTFLECGAHDGDRWSVTYIFEAAGWSGVLVEPLPEFCATCRERRPRSRVVQAAASCRGSSGTAEFLSLSGDPRDDAMSRLAGSSQADVKAMRRANKVTVPLTTMDAILADGTPKVDLAVLDVEGSELDLLDGFDLERFGVRVLLIEEHTGEKDTPLRRLMESRNYEFVSRVGRNDLYVTRREPALIKRAAQLAKLQ